ncbi:hypothetical protein LJC10_05125 [Selenomonadales bacterium OttesenSCG-928-I06]|nr:hypothetical protein [Selenomonadales bacterium OttesenSCG-928-I06]
MLKRKAKYSIITSKTPKETPEIKKEKDLAAKQFANICARLAKRILEKQC